MNRDPIADFWAWWRLHHARLAEACDRGRLGRLGDQLDDVIAALDPGLEWEIGTGGRPRSLVVSAAGDSRLRPLTERWARAAPPAADRWVFHPARVPVPLEPFRLGEVEIDPEAIRLTLTGDDVFEQVDVIVWHPRFDDLPEPLRLQIAFRVLDAALGEDSVERWIGIVDAVVEPPANGVPASALAREVAEFAAGFTGESFELVEDRDLDGRPELLTVNRAFKRIDHLFHDLYVEVDLPYLGDERTELPTDSELAELEGLEDEVDELLGDSAAFFARSTGGGRRRLHWYAVPDPRIEARLEDWRARHSEQPIAIWLELDPEWTAQERWS